jgi:hypothetical protein
MWRWVGKDKHGTHPEEAITPKVKIYMKPLLTQLIYFITIMESTSLLEVEDPEYVFHRIHNLETRVSSPGKWWFRWEMKCVGVHQEKRKRKSTAGRVEQHIWRPWHTKIGLLEGRVTECAEICWESHLQSLSCVLYLLVWFSLLGKEPALLPPQCVD